MGGSGTIEDYKRRIAAAVSYIDSHLGSELSLAILANEAAFSEFHFLRIFSSLQGESPAAYVRRLRLERGAARLIVEPALRITILAADLGYPDPASFSRAFRKYYGSSPEAFRRSPGSASPRFRPPEPSPPFSPRAVEVTRVEESDAVSCRGLEHRGAYDIGLLSTYKRVWRGARSAGLAAYPLFVVPLDPPHLTEEKRLRCFIGVEAVAKEDLLPTSFTEYSIPAGLRAVYHFSGPPDGIDRGFHDLYLHWLPGSGFLPGEGPAYMIHLDDRILSLIPRRCEIDLVLPLRRQ
jgi:AraC family transcriptional regulator